MSNIAMQETPNQIESLARAFLHTPFVRGGRTANGLDCVGLVIAVGKQVGVFAPDFELPPYTVPPNPALFAEWLPQFFTQKPFAQLAASDVVVLTSGKKRRPRHMGIIATYANDPAQLSLIYLNEASAPACVVETRLTDDLKARIDSVWAWPVEKCQSAIA